MDRPPLGVLRDRRALVHGLPDDVEDAAERRLAHRDGDRLARVHDLHAAHDAVRRAHRDGADLVAPDVLLDFGDELATVHFHRDRVVQLGQLLGLELDVDDWSNDLHNFPNVTLLFTGLRCHVRSLVPGVGCLVPGVWWLVAWNHALTPGTRHETPILSTLPLPRQSPPALE